MDTKSVPGAVAVGVVVGLVAMSAVLYSYYQTHPNMTTTTATARLPTTTTLTTTLTASEVQLNYVYITTTSVSTSVASMFPPSNSSYALTYVTGNSTITESSCGNFVVALYVTYEMHTQVTTNIIQWAVFPSGVLTQPNSQKSFTNQAYLTIYTTYDYSSGRCEVGMIPSLSAFVTDTNNNQLSPRTFFIVLNEV